MKQNTLITENLVKSNVKDSEAVYLEVLSKNFQIIGSFMKKIDILYLKQQHFQVKLEQYFLRLQKVEQDEVNIHHEFRTANLLLEKKMQMVDRNYVTKNFNKNLKTSLSSIQYENEIDEQNQQQFRTSEKTRKHTTTKTVNFISKKQSNNYSFTSIPSQPAFKSSILKKSTAEYPKNLFGYKDQCIQQIQEMPQEHQKTCGTKIKNLQQLLQKCMERIDAIQLLAFQQNNQIKALQSQLISIGELYANQSKSQSQTQKKEFTGEIQTKNKQLSTSLDEKIDRKIKIVCRNISQVRQSLELKADKCEVDQAITDVKSFLTEQLKNYHQNATHHKRKSKLLQPEDTMNIGRFSEGCGSSFLGKKPANGIDSKNCIFDRSMSGKNLSDSAVFRENNDKNSSVYLDSNSNFTMSEKEWKKKAQQALTKKTIGKKSIYR